MQVRNTSKRAQIREPCVRPRPKNIPGYSYEDMVEYRFTESVCASGKNNIRCSYALLVFSTPSQYGRGNTLRCVIDFSLKGSPGSLMLTRFSENGLRTPQFQSIFSAALSRVP